MSGRITEQGCVPGDPGEQLSLTHQMFQRRTNTNTFSRIPDGAKRAKHAYDSGLPAYPFEADFCDHFETPRNAYEHVAPFLQTLCKLLKRKQDTLQIYDPYYCKGAVRDHLRALGFPAVFNQCEDFYDIIAKDWAPSFDVLITNPPYSEDHKARCIKFCVDSKQPFLLLMPCYVAGKRYFSESRTNCFFILPEEKYQYSHPTGKGHEESPFKSMWFVGSGNSEEAALMLKAARACGAYGPGRGARVVTSLEELQDDGVVALKRLNPKRRKREALKRKQGTA